MTFKYVFWKDAIEFKNGRDVIRCILFSVFGVVFLLSHGATFQTTFEQVSSSSSYLFSLGLLVVVALLVFYINTAIQGLELTSEWENEGDRDGRYWTEHLFVGLLLMFSLHAFLTLAFEKDIFDVNGLFTANQLLVELPLAFIFFASVCVTVFYFAFCIFCTVILGMVRWALSFNQKENFSLEKNHLLHVWQTLSEKEQDEMKEKRVLLEKTLEMYQQLSRKHRKKQKETILLLFNQFTNECMVRSRNKNLLK